MMADYIEATKKKNEEVMVAKRKAAQEDFEKQHSEKIRKYEVKVVKINSKSANAEEGAQSLL